MNAAIYPTILTGLGVIVTLIVTMHNLAKTNQQETNRRRTPFIEQLARL